MTDLQSRAIANAAIAERWLGGVLARDDLHLMPARISRAAYARAMRGLARLEAYVRRMLIFLALQLEHEIEVDMSERPVRQSKRDGAAEGLKDRSASRLRIFEPCAPLPDTFPSNLDDRAERSPPDPSRIYVRTQRLQALLGAPYERARRLAFVLARRRHGLILAPDPHINPRRLGTEAGSLFEAFGHGIMQASRRRPPPRGPRPRPPPRIRLM